MLIDRDLIKRSDALKWTNPEDWDTPDERWRAESEYGRYIQSLPTAERKGKWISYIDDDGFVECPFCGSATNCDSTEEMETLHYCFNCGARMVSEE